MKSALITGITGQDGSYLAELLLEKGYDVYGLIRRLSTPNISRIEHILSDVELVEGDLTDQSSITDAIHRLQPDEVYNLAAQSFVGTSWNQPVLTGDVTGLGVVRVLEGVRHSCPDAHVYQASSSEMFGKVHETPQNEKTRFYPRSPYGFAKVYGYWACVNWGHAADYVEAMWLMLQQEEPDDYVIATGETHSVQEFVELAFDAVGLDWEKYVVVDPKFVRPADVELLQGDASKAIRVLGWEPKVTFEELVTTMVDADMERLK